MPSALPEFDTAEETGVGALPDFGGALPEFEEEAPQQPRMPAPPRPTNLAQALALPTSDLRTPEEWAQQTAIEQRAKALPITAPVDRSTAESISGAPGPLVTLPQAPPVTESPRLPGEAMLGGLPTESVLGPAGADIQAEVQRTLYNAAKQVPEFFTTEEGMLAGLASLTPLGKAGVTAYFTYDMAKSVLDQAKQMGEDWDKASTLDKARLLTQAIGTLGFTGLLAKAGVGEIGKRLPVRPARPGPFQGPLATGEVLVTPPGARAPLPEVTAPETVSPEVAARQAAQMTREATATPVERPAGAPPPEVPATPPEPQRGLTVLDEIRRAGARTTAQVQALFPERNLTRQEAAAFRRDAWGEAPPEPAPKPVSEEPPPAPEPVPEEPKGPSFLGQTKDVWTPEYLADRLAEEGNRRAIVNGINGAPELKRRFALKPEAKPETILKAIHDLIDAREKVRAEEAARPAAPTGEALKPIIDYFPGQRENIERIEKLIEERLGANALAKARLKARREEMTFGKYEQMLEEWERRSRVAAPAYSEPAKLPPAEPIGEAPPAAPAPEAKAKSVLIQRRIKEGIPPENIQIVVSKDPAVPDFGFVQVDEIHPERGNIFSSNAEQMRELGYDMPSQEELMDLPAGKYRLPEVRNMIVAKKLGVRYRGTQMGRDQYAWDDPKAEPGMPSVVDFSVPAGTGEEGVAARLAERRAQYEEATGAPEAQAPAAALPTVPAGRLIEVPRSKKPLEAERNQIVRALQSLEEEGRAGVMYPKEGKEETVKRLRDRLAVVEKQLMPKPAPSPAAQIQPPAPPKRPTVPPATDELQALRNKQTLWGHALELLTAREGQAEAAFDKLNAIREFGDPDLQDARANWQRIKSNREKLQRAVSGLEGEIGIARMRAEAAPFRGIPQPSGTQNITGKVLKAQKDNLLSQVDDAIKAAPEETSEKITISVPGDGDFTIENSKDALKRFRALAEQQFPSSVGGPGQPKLPSDKGKSIPKVSEPKDADLPKLVGDFTSTEKDRYVLLTSYSDGTQIVATDGRQLIRIVSDRVPGSPDSPVRLSPKGVVTEVEGRYPNWKAVGDPDKQLLYGGMDTGQALHIVRQAQVFRDTSITDKDKRGSVGLDLFVNPDRSLGGRMTAAGDSFEHNVQPGALRMGSYNPDYLANALIAARKLGNERVDVYAHSGDTGPLGMVGKNHETITMPLRMEGQSIRDASNQFLNVAGRAEHGTLPEGYGPLVNPDELISRSPDMGAAGKWNIEVVKGEIRVNRGESYRNYQGATATRWDETGSMKLEDWPKSANEQAKAVARLFAKAPVPEVTGARQVIAKKLRDAVVDALQERQGYLEEAERRKAASTPATMLGPGAAGAGGEIIPTGPRGTPEPPTYGPSSRMLEARRLRGVIAPVEPGEGIGVEASIQRGRDLLAQGADPEKIMAEMERTKRFNSDDSAVLRAHGERLEQAAYAAADKYGVVSDEYEAAWKADSDWSRRFKVLATEWHKTGQSLQGETEIDTGTFHGLRKAWFDATGKDFTPKQAEDATRIAKGVKDATDAADKAKNDLVTNLDKETAKAPEKPPKPATGKQGEAVPDTKTIWKRARAMLDAGETDFDNIRQKLAIEFGLPLREVSRLLAEPKGAKKLTDEMYRKMSDRRRLVSQAKSWLKNQQIPGWLRFIRAIPRVFFIDKIIGHGTVGMITHAGLNVFNPGAWKTYWPNFFRQYKLLFKPAYHERMMQDLLRDPNYAKARRAGLVNDPFRYVDDYNSAFVQYFRKLGLGGSRGFDSLKLFRQARFNQLWDRLTPESQTPQMAQVIADAVNHATGVVRMPFREWSNWTFFAPKLEGSRWAWMIGDPLRAAKTFADWRNSTSEARAFAMGQLKEKAAITGTYLGLLALNQGILQAMDSKEKINYTNPRRGDFLAFKVAGYQLGVISPMLGMVRLFANLIHASAGHRGQVESLSTRSSEFGELGASYLRGKLSPFAGFGVDIVSQADFQGRPMPYSSDRVPAYLRREGIPPYTYGEYAAQQFTPIPVSEAIREVWREQGMNEDQIKVYLHAITVAGFMGATGARLSTPSVPAPAPPARFPSFQSVLQQ